MNFYQDSIFDFNKDCSLSSVYIKTLDSKIYFIDDVFLHPHKVYEYWSQFPIKSHKVCSTNTLNGKTFMDGRAKSELPREDYQNLLEVNVHRLVKKIYGKENWDNLRDTRSVNQFYLLEDMPKKKVWWPHSDVDSNQNSVINILTYLNPQIKNGPGTSLYVPNSNYISIGDEHSNPWIDENNFKQVLSIFGYFNRMVIFPGSITHGMTASNMFKNFVRIVQVQFI